ncbi:MAG: nicotinate (nicotinamide) nucleotide adenylyltransferase [Magnetococcales bacterium]|nr:nicotinate (nicotinamide) nucleotide adenylyltransferase [Magnetococcales bacterium]
MSATPRIGLLGGAFDPPHIGHLIPAREAAERLDLSKVLLVPAGGHPFKGGGGGMTPAAHRLAMTRLAAAGEPRLVVSELETAREGVTFTIDTVRTLARSEPELEIHLLLGSDLLGELHLWREWERLTDYAHVVVMGRPGYRALDPRLPVAELWCPLQVERVEALDRRRLGRFGVATLEVSALEVSSTEIRSRLRTGREIRWFTPEPVREYIRAHGLYRG